jgi:hypothetical protein
MGTPNAATVTGLTKFVVHELSRDAVAPLLTDHPDLLHALERGAEKARSLIERRVAAQTCGDPPPSVHALDRIRAFFGARDHAPSPRESVSSQTQVETG